MISRFAAYAPIYRAFDVWPRNCVLDRPAQSRREAVEIARTVPERMNEGAC